MPRIETEWTRERKREGARLTASIMRERAAQARADYLANPNLCRRCREPILPAPSDKPNKLRAKVFCSSRCAAIFNQAEGPSRKVRRVRHCRTCGSEMQHELSGSFDRKNCKRCWSERLVRLGNKTKAEAGRRSIANHARYRMRSEPPLCAVCGYDVHVETAHLRSVASFPITALVKEINDPENLRWLCPNHHLEFDRGLLPVEKLQRPVNLTPHLKAA